MIDLPEGDASVTSMFCLCDGGVMPSSLAQKRSVLKIFFKEDKKGFHKKHFIQQAIVYITKLFFIIDTNNN
jgi:hypothetical protein